jgi:virulence-associated protein VagC
VVYGKVFRRGNSQAVPFPRSARFRADEREIVMRGDALMVQPGKAAHLTDAIDTPVSVGADVLPEDREQGPSEEREEF